MHGVSAAAIGREAGEGPARVLEKQNQSLHPGMKISRLAWIKKLDEKKAFSSLIVEVSDAATANRMISEGVIHGHELKRAELYDKTCKITRCFNYQKYESHISKYCRNPCKYGNCGGAHLTETCTATESTGRRRCAAYNGGDHTA